MSNQTTILYNELENYCHMSEGKWVKLYYFLFPQGVPGGTVAAEYGGVSNISRLTLTPTHEDDQQIYACRATNAQLEVTVSDAVTLDVMCE